MANSIAMQELLEKILERHLIVALPSRKVVFETYSEITMSVGFAANGIYVIVRSPNAHLSLFVDATHYLWRFRCLKDEEMPPFPERITYTESELPQALENLAHTLIKQGFKKALKTYDNQSIDRDSPYNPFIAALLRFLNRWGLWQ